MANTYYLGRDPEAVLGESTRFFYALRRNQDGELFFQRIDLLKDQDVVDINKIGIPDDTFEDFEEGIDFFEGIDNNHVNQFPNITYPQYRWDDRSIFYYIDEEGRFVQRINRGYDYPEGISSDESQPPVADSTELGGTYG